jgi:phosphatidylserine decarboxylase
LASPTRGPSRKPQLADGTPSWLVPAAVASAAAAWLCRRSLRLSLVTLPAVAVTGGMLWFFRDPERDSAEGGVLSGADGVVQSVDTQPDGRVRIAVFMNPLNVHVNRAPLAGTVTSVTHVPGGYLPAFNKDSERNERMVWHFDTELGDIEVVQIAGAMVRRIVPYLREGDKVERGQRIGLIRFGSRLDVYLPPGTTPAVRVGDKTLAGVTRLDREVS